MPAAIKVQGSRKRGLSRAGDGNYFDRIVRQSIRSLYRKLLSPFPLSLRVGYLVERAGIAAWVEVRDYKENGFLLSHRDASNPRLQYRIAFPDQAVWLLRDAIFYPRSGVVTLKGHPILESRPNGKRSIGLLGHVQPAKALDITSSAVGVGSRNWNYYHWLLEEIPTLLRAFECDPKVMCLTDRTAPSYVQESIRVLGVSHTMVERPVRVPKLLVPDRGPRGWARASEVDIIRRAFHSSRGSTSLPEASRAIFVSRSGSKRSFRGERELEQALVALGVEIVRAENLSFSEQIELFSTAKLVIGTHGAGLTNIVFAPAKCEIIEIAASTNMNQCFEALAGAVGQRYRRLVIAQNEGFDSGRIGSSDLVSILENVRACM